MNNIMIGRLFLSIAILGIWLYSPAHATVADGVFAYEQGDYQKAREEWLPYAALGNANALYNLGQLYRMGRGVEENYIKAEEYYQRAAEQGHIGAQRNLGTLYYFGRTGKVDHEKALKWLTKAAVNGDARSQLMAGTMYFNGEAGEIDAVKAYAWITLAAQAGLRNADDALTKLNNNMTKKQLEQARILAPNLMMRQISPDDVGLMVNQQESITTDIPPLNQDIAEDDEKNAVSDPVPSIQEAPKTEPSDHSVTEIPDNFRIQLASFRTEKSAAQAFQKLMNKLSNLLKGKESAIEYADLGEKGIFWRLQLKSFDTKNQAEAFCGELKENGQDCYVVKAP
ncbi:MAG: SPOR domain-containing protein [Emcibacter sp.]|nr:SPOR domain-containing protein [Emcibacter sp.]